MNLKATLPYCWIIFFMTLAACAPAKTPLPPTADVFTATSLAAAVTPSVTPPPPTQDMEATFAPLLTTIVVKATARAQLTQTAGPTKTQTPTLRLTRTPFPITTPLPLVKLDGLRVAYVLDGNLYIQDSGDQPVQLTHSGEDYMPMLLYDGEKVLFFRGASGKQNRLYVINADGAEERPLVTGEILASLGLGYDQLAEISDWELVPGTHQLLFNTQTFDARLAMDAGDWGHGTHFMNNHDLLIADLDSAEIKRLNRKPWDGPWMDERAFQVSPNGRWITDSFNIFDIQGNLVRNLIRPPDAWEVEEVYPRWAQDSSKLIILPPIDGGMDPQDGPEPRTVWQYPLDGSPAVEIRLDPAPMGNHYSFTVSPDGNWIAYTYSYQPGKTDASIPQGVYLGNLRNGTTNLIGPSSIYGWPDGYYWSPDSRHFIFSYDRENQLYLGSIQGEIIPLNAIGFFGWIDNERYLYQDKDVFMGKIGEEKRVPVVALLKPLKNTYANIDSAYFTYVYRKP